MIAIPSGSWARSRVSEYDAHESNELLKAHQSSMSGRSGIHQLKDYISFLSSAEEARSRLIPGVNEQWAYVLSGASKLRRRTYTRGTTSIAQ